MVIFYKYKHSFYLGIKTGRYTYEKRTKDIMELKMMEQSQAVVKDTDNEDETKHLMNIAQKVRILADKLLEDMQAVSGDSQEVERKQKQFVPDPNCTYNGLDGEILRNAGQYMTSSKETSHSSFVPTNITKEDNENNKTVSDDTKQFYIRSSQRGITLNDSGKSDTQTQTDNKRDVKLAWFRTIEFGIRCLVRFIKAIPGFKNLHIDDQLNLIKRKYPVV